MANDVLEQFKAGQREAWSLFAPIEALTTAPAGHLVQYSRMAQGDRVLDVACGTGVVAITAARRGASVNALDLSPVLLEKARFNAKLAQVEVEFKEGDVEALPYKDGEFDFVVSQFGHMFGPRPAVVVNEMLRVLKPGGTIAFSTWPPELFTGRMFALTAKYLPPPPPEVAPPPQWGDPNVIRERLGDRVTDLGSARRVMYAPALSPQHVRNYFENNVAPLIRLVESLKNDTAKLAQFRAEVEALAATYMDGNVLRQDFLMTRATKKR